MADINNIESVEDLIEVLDEYIKTPRTPALNGGQLNLILKAVIEFAGGTGGGTAPDASTTVKGLIKLAGDLGGTAAAPTVPGLVNKQNTLVSGTNIKTVGGVSIVGPGNIPLPEGGSTPDATTSIKGKIQLAGDLGGTAEAPTVPGLVNKAPKASPAFTGIPTAPTAAQGTNTTQIATTAYVVEAIAEVEGSDAVRLVTLLSADLTGNQYANTDWEGKTYKVFLNSIGRFMTHETEWEYLESGGFEILDPEFVLTADDSLVIMGQITGAPGVPGPIGPGTYDYWLSIEGNEGKTVEEFIAAISSGAYVDAPGYDLNLMD